MIQEKDLVTILKGDNLRSHIRKNMIEDRFVRWKEGTVSTYSATLVTLTITDTQASVQVPYLTSYSPATNDVVAVLTAGRSLQLCIGKMTT